MRLFISKYELRELIFEEHLYHDRDITLLYIGQQLCDNNKMYCTKVQHMILY
jgi:hypothetical protein